MIISNSTVILKVISQLGEHKKNTKKIPSISLLFKLFGLIHLVDNL
jgi:hypothetical protein